MAVVRSEVNFEPKSVSVFSEINWSNIVNGICLRPTFHSFAPTGQEFTPTSYVTDPLARWAKEDFHCVKPVRWVTLFYMIKWFSDYLKKDHELMGQFFNCPPLYINGKDE